MEIQIQLSELHFTQASHCDYAAIKSRAEEILNEGLDAPDPEGVKETFLLFHKNHCVKRAEGQLPAQTAILAAHKPIEIERYADDIQQSWSCRNAGELLKPSRHTLIVAEMMAQGLPPQDRVRLFHGVLLAAVEQTQPIALVFKHSQQVVEPRAYLKAAAEEPIFRPGTLNVRFFRISNSEGDMIMDTRGLHAIGLHDLQCHYRGLDPNDVSRVLYNTALYVFEHGPVIESGHTIEGVQPGSKWKCQFEESLLEPKRELLDLNPGPPYAAGVRH